MTTTTTTHAIGSREEWLTARLALLDAEKELTRRSDELASQRQEATGRGVFNFRPPDVPTDDLDPASDAYVDQAESPGMSAFVQEKGEVFHTYSAYSRGIDALWGMYQWLDRAPKGRNDGEAIWFRRHDEYPNT